jgi:hypothetical protein
MSNLWRAWRSLRAKGAPATATLGANVLIRRRPSLSEPRAANADAARW